MRKNKSNIWLLINTLALLLIAGFAVLLFIRNEDGFTGNRIKNPDSYIMDIERMNGTDLHTLELKADDSLHVEFETKKGSLYMEIKAPDGTVLYSGNGRETTDFTVNIPEDGVYTIAVEARRAKGAIHIKAYNR